MPADRGRSSRRNDASELRDASFVLAPSWTENVASAQAPPEGVPQQILFEQEGQLQRRTKPAGRKKPENYVPRPPNAFILFRSSFIKSRHVSSEVETNHSTLSKIIGLTWQNLPEEERQKWHAAAKVAHDEHKRQFPQYSFKPVHTKARGVVAERKRLREVGPKDQKRCAKIAELLVCGKKGQELEEAIHEFDKYHIPEIVTRFETPITATSFESGQSDGRSSSPENLRVPSPPRRAPKASSTRSPSLILTPPQDTVPLLAPIPIHSLETHSFDTLDQAPSFDMPSFAFTITEPSPSNFVDCQYPGDASNSTLHPFESQHLQDPANLCPNPQYSSRMDDSWQRHGSPLSNSTSSMPSTPSQLCVPFPESYTPSAFHVNDADYGAIAGGSYCDFSQYPPFAPISEPSYGGAAKDSGSDGRYADINSSQLQISQDLDFPSFMQMVSLPMNSGGYSL
ncbi:hypothetical protein BDN70DRAFT_896339 [Pholiota conissans]|uniref:HMG box domain-containing protein n=1 Tax=Pholiota conissans TaxID=109636 RepID=A0A9P5YXL1_9AGAR|nr:hypothetical protein BDN70DRAFT_896339 [Pholiota conissans]